MFIESDELKLFQNFKTYLSKYDYKLARLGLFHSEKALNGQNKKIRISDLLSQYEAIHLPMLTESSRYRLKERLNRLLKPISPICLCHLEPKLVSHFINFSKENHEDKFSRKCSFIKELKDFKAMLNWHKNQNDFRFENPIQPYHLKLAVMKPVPKRHFQISKEEFEKFMLYLSPFYKRFAIAQLCMAARCGEVAGLQKKNVDFEKGIVTIREVMVWIKSTPKVKSLPKNGQERSVFMNETLRRVLKEQMQLSPPDSPFVFAYKKTSGIRYNSLNKAYNTAWKRADLRQYSGTHIVRYFAARTAREMYGSLEHVQAITGHKSSSLAAQYSAGDTSKLNKEVSNGFDSLGL